MPLPGNGFELSLSLGAVSVAVAMKLGRSATRPDHLRVDSKTKGLRATQRYFVVTREVLLGHRMSKWKRETTSRDREASEVTEPQGVAEHCVVCSLDVFCVRAELLVSEEPGHLDDWIHRQERYSIRQGALGTSLGCTSKRVVADLRGLEFSWQTPATHTKGATAGQGRFSVVLRPFNSQRLRKP